MNSQNWDRLLMDLSNHEEVAAVEIDGEDLVARLRGEAIRITGDRDFGRTVLWAPVLRVPDGETAAASEAALRFNTEQCADSTATMGFFAQRSVLLLGRSIEAWEPGAGGVVAEALDLLDLLAAARSFVKSALEPCNEPDAKPVVTNDLPAIRV